MSEKLTESVKLLRELKKRFDNLEEKEVAQRRMIIKGVSAGTESATSSVKGATGSLVAEPIPSKNLWQLGTLQPGEKRIRIVQGDAGFTTTLTGDLIYNGERYNYAEY